jgi:hypothetical protein
MQVATHCIDKFQSLALVGQRGDSQSAAMGAGSPAEVFPLFLLTFGVGFVAFGRLLARADGSALLDFIRQTTGAQHLGPEQRPFC